ncbi:MAG: hypothetical protein OET90_02200 [Desulfuromonadales bacterium]|nr:hypothetical protein [Desulfuromonadales bacterium]
MARVDSLNVTCDSCGENFVLSGRYLATSFPVTCADNSMVVTCEHCKEDDVLTLPCRRTANADAF